MSTMFINNSGVPDIEKWAKWAAIIGIIAAIFAVAFGLIQY